jgi:adenylate cyclase
MVVSGDAGLPPPAGVEKSALDRIRAPQHVRLACQIRPRQDISVRMLIPTPAPGRPAPHANRGFEWGGERELTVMFADMRGFSNLALYQSPADITLLLNRLLDELLEAVELRGGVVASIETDGVLALFGLDEAAGAGARAAVEAAVDALKVADRLNAEIGVAVTQPIRFGVGLHTGRLVVAEIGDVERGYRLAPIGVTVVIADRLQEATKEFSADCVVSAETLAAARLAPKDGRAVAIHYKNGDAPVAAWAYPTRRELARLLGRREAAEAEPAKAPAASAVIPGETA